MGSVKARRYFDSFVRAWNDGRLSPKYYKQDGELSSLSKSVVTRHDWGLAADAGQQLAAARHRPLTANTVGQPRGAHDPAQDRLADEVRRDDERRRRKRERREAKEREELFLDEVAPKETGREAKIAKKRNLNQARHGEKSPDMDIPDDDLFRDTGDDLAALKRDRDAHERRQQARRQAARTAQGRETRIKEHADRERSTVEALRAMAEQSREQGLGMMRRPAPP
ncbi:hypothetical protein LPJ61_001147 [Coemansia biformis]|uniref:Uncharacterized protein n=1 Tax=Coemansia biformis TaxID=1286918 RepID=A0A9W7YI98_9FUNG|nr:hypothetical protein LPJ61_001147 [Coemansia biformis]